MTIVKPLLHLFHSEPGNGLWKRKADTAMRHCTVSGELLCPKMYANNCFICPSSSENKFSQEPIISIKFYNSNSYPFKKSLYFFITQRNDAQSISIFLSEKVVFQG